MAYPYLVNKAIPSLYITHNTTPVQVQGMTQVLDITLKGPIKGRIMPLIATHRA